MIKCLTGYHYPGGCLDVGIRADPGRAFPGPTPIAGVPELYAALTISVPPVARIIATPGWRISNVVVRRVGRRGTLWDEIDRRSVSSQDLAEQVHSHGPDVCRVALAAHDERVSRLDAD